MSPRDPFLDPEDAPCETCGEIWDVDDLIWTDDGVGFCDACYTSSGGDFEDEDEDEDEDEWEDEDEEFGV